MSDYVKSTDFASKDTLPSGDSAKIVRGTEIDAEFEALEVAIATKANTSDVSSTYAPLNSPTFTGNPTAPTPTSGDNDTSIATTAFVSAITGTNGINSFKNRIINGAMMIDQRNAGASISVSGAGGYTLDRWNPNKNGSINNFTCQRSTVAPAGFLNSMLFTMGTGVTPTSSDYAYFAQNIEGFNAADLGFGTATAATVTLSFWVRSSVTGTFGVGLRNSSGGRCYIASYTISSANTWEQKSVTIAGDTSGTWLTDNGIGIRVDFDLGVGTSNSTTAGSWQSANCFGLTGGTKLAATTGATFYITGVQLEKGSTATSFDYRPYGTELALCQRYYAKRGVGGLYTLPSGGGYVTVYYKVPMRTTPTLTISADFGQATVPTCPDGTNMFGLITQASTPIGFSADLSAEL